LFFEFFIYCICVKTKHTFLVVKTISKFHFENNNFFYTFHFSVFKTKLFQFFFLNYDITNNMSKPTLRILSQTCLQEKTQNVNGVNKHVRVVVKNQPSFVKLVLVGVEPNVSFRSLGIEASLLYDGLVDKPVDFLKAKPLDYSGHVENNPLEYSLELNINALSSQHEDSLFKVKIQAVTLNSRQPIPGLCCYTTEILVISKPEVLRPKAPKGGQKRARDDQVLQNLARLERKLDEMAAAVSREREVILKKEIVTLHHNHHNVSEEQQRRESLSAAEEMATKKRRERENENSSTQAPRLESAIPNLLSAFNALTDEERPEKVRRLFHTLGEDEKDQLAQLVDLFLVEGLPSRRTSQLQSISQQRNTSTTDVVVAASPSNEDYLEFDSATPGCSFFELPAFPISNSDGLHVGDDSLQLLRQSSSSHPFDFQFQLFNPERLPTVEL